MCSLLRKYGHQHTIVLYFPENKEKRENLSSIEAILKHAQTASMAAAEGKKAMTKRVVEDLAIDDTELEMLDAGANVDASADAHLTSVPQTILNTVRW